MSQHSFVHKNFDFSHAIIMGYSLMIIRLPETRLPDQEIDSPQGRITVPGQVLPERSIEVDAEEISDLLQSARRASASAYAPFSGFRVGAALRMSDDPENRIFIGSNIENSSYGATNCAERTAIFSASTAGFRRIRILALATAEPVTGKHLQDAPLSLRSPCGICRQVIQEFAGSNTLLAFDSSEGGKLCDLLDLERILPWGFRLQTDSDTESGGTERKLPAPATGEQP